MDITLFFSANSDFLRHKRQNKKKPPSSFWTTEAQLKRRLPTLPLLRSTIGVTGLNFSVRNGKRWNPGAIITWITFMQNTLRQKQSTLNVYNNSYPLFKWYQPKSLGQLVTLGCDVTIYTPASYQRHRLWRPSGKSNLVAGFALRCFQRLSDPDVDTRQCTWRHNRQTRGQSNTVLSY